MIRKLKVTLTPEAAAIVDKMFEMGEFDHLGVEKITKEEEAEKEHLDIESFPIRHGVREAKFIFRRMMRRKKRKTMRYDVILESVQAEFRNPTLAAIVTLPKCSTGPDG